MPKVCPGDSAQPCVLIVVTAKLYGAPTERGVQLVRTRLQCRRLQFNTWVGKIHWRRDRLLTPVFLGFPCDSAGKESTCNVGDLGLLPGLGRSPGEGEGYPLQYSGLENSMDSIVYGVTKSWTQLSDFHFYLLCPKHCSMGYTCLIHLICPIGLGGQAAWYPICR